VGILAKGKIKGFYVSEIKLNSRRISLKAGSLIVTCLLFPKYFLEYLIQRKRRRLGNGDQIS
jgi:hypothetical protein